MGKVIDVFKAIGVLFRPQDLEEYEDSAELAELNRLSKASIDRLENSLEDKNSRKKPVAHIETETPSQTVSRKVRSSRGNSREM